MQQIYDVIAEAQGGEAIPNLARSFGLTPQQAEAVIAETLPALVRGIERNTLSRGGLADLVKALGAGHHEQILERPDVYADPRVQQDGMGVLGHLLGSESKARGLSLQAARATGISDSIIQMLLPIIAQMLMGAISRWLKGGLGDIAGRLPGGGQMPGGGGLPFPMPGGDGGGGSGGGRDPGYGRGFELPKADTPMPQGGYPMPPMPGGGGDGGFRRGGTMEELPRPPPQAPSGGGLPWPFPRGGGQDGGQPGDARGGFPMPWPQQGGPQQQGGGGGGQGLPLPLPGPQSSGDNPYGDLSDIIRRKGVSNGVDGGGLWGAVRGMLGGALGFQSKGVMSWIIRAVIVRYGWQILRRLLFRR